MPKDAIKDAIINQVNKIKDKADDVLEVAKDGGDKLKNELAIKANDAVADVQKGGKKVADKYADTVDAINRKIYDPVSKDEFLADSFDFPTMVRILDKNIHADKEVCKNAVGFRHLVAKNSVLELIKKEFPDNKIRFYPNLNAPFYYRDPYDELLYISLDDYFEFIKTQKVSELENIASSLGAKYVKIVFKEKKKSFVSAEAKKGSKSKSKKAIGKGDDHVEESESVKVSASDLHELEVASEMEFAGNSEPERPNLVYFKNDSNIESLISMCLDGKNPPKSKTFTLSYNRASDLNIEAALKIDAVLDKLGLAATASVKSEVEKEKRMFMEYQIKF